MGVDTKEKLLGCGSRKSISEPPPPNKKKIKPRMQRQINVYSNKKNGARLSQCAVDSYEKIKNKRIQCEICVFHYFVYLVYIKKKGRLCYDIGFFKGKINKLSYNLIHIHFTHNGFLLLQFTRLSHFPFLNLKTKNYCVKNCLLYRFLFLFIHIQYTYHIRKYTKSISKFSFLWLLLFRVFYFVFVCPVPSIPFTPSCSFFQFPFIRPVVYG